MSNVVALKIKRRRVLTTTSEAFEEAWTLFPDTGRLRSSRKDAYPEWITVAAEIGEEALVECVRRYATLDKDHRRECGAPAFHRWLNWGRYEHWMPPPPPPVVVQIFENAPLRASFFARFKDQRARDWLDAGSWNDLTHELTAPPAREEWIRGPLMDWMKANGVRALNTRGRT